MFSTVSPGAFLRIGTITSNLLSYRVDGQWRPAPSGSKWKTCAVWVISHRPMTCAASRRCPLFTIPRNSSCLSLNESTSSISRVGWADSMERKTVDGDTFEVTMARGTSLAISSSKVVLPHRFSGESSASRGLMSKQSSAWARMIHNAMASAACAGRIT